MLAAILGPFLFAVVVPLLFRWRRNRVGWWVAAVPLALFCWFTRYIPSVAHGAVLDFPYRWAPSLGLSLNFRLDGLSLLFALLITGIGFVIVVYSVRYFSGHPEDPLDNFYVFLLLFLGSMLGVVLSDNLIALYVFWELTSLASYLLIGFWFHRDPSRYGALKSMLITVAGGLAMLAGFVLIYLVTGSFSLNEAIRQGERLLSAPLYEAILVLVLLGAFTKSAQFPFHIWLPNAMEAPTPVSAYLHSATMVKAGIYLLARLSPALAADPAWFYSVSLVGLITLCYGAVMAIRQTDLKALLAYSTISQLGLVTSLLGFNTPLAAAAAAFHLLNHAAFKGTLFLGVGIVEHETHTRELPRLGGLARELPLTTTAMALAAFASAGLPPFGAFISKEMFFAASLAVAGPWPVRLYPFLAVFGSIFTLAYSFTVLFKVFFGPKKEKVSTPAEKSLVMPGPALVLAALTLVFGLFPGTVGEYLVAPAAAAIGGRPVEAHLGLWHGLNWPLLMSGLVVALGLFVYLNLDAAKRLVETVSLRRYHLNWLYDTFVEGLPRWSDRLTLSYMTGYLRDYLAFILIWFVLSVGYALGAKEGLKLFGFDLAPLAPYEVVAGCLMVAAALAVAVLPRRLPAVLALGAVGYLVALFFIIMRAPDLALTQLFIETVSLILYLLVFVHLPELKKEVIGWGQKAVNLVVAAASGLVVTLLLLSGNATRLFAPISRYYVETSHSLGGGNNIVNVILVDFRGYDTMGEITVVSVAAFAVYALAKLRLGKDRGKAAKE